MVEAFVEEIAQGWQAQAEHVGDDVRLDELGGVSRECDRDLGAGRLCAIDRDVERHARAGRFLGSGGGDDQEARHWAISMVDDGVNA